MNIDRDALEIVFQAGGEMFDRRVFNSTSLSPEIKWPDENFGIDDNPMTREKLEELSSALHNAARNSVLTHIDSKIGYTLSGGVDSSLLLYLIKKEFPDADIAAYHTDWKFAERSELEFAKLAAKFADVPLKVIDVSPDAQVPYVEDGLSKSKVIAYSTIPVYMVHNAMKEDNITVAVNALGLDELFAGYIIHRRYYNRGRLHFVPNIGSLTSTKLYRGASIKWGGDKAFILADCVPTYSKRFVKDTSASLSALYDEKIKSGNLWLDIQRWILFAMIGNYANLIARPALANGVSILFPYMNHALMALTHTYGPNVKRNKAPIRTLMRDFYGFPEEIAKRGEEWDKIGWGGTIAPYVTSKDYLDAITPTQSNEEDWFTNTGLKEYQTFPEKPTVRAIHMALFLKTFELL